MARYQAISTPANHNQAGNEGYPKTHRHGEERSHLYACKSTSGGLRGHHPPRHGEERSHLYTCKSTSGGLREHIMPHAIPNDPKPAVMARNDAISTLADQHPAGNGAIKNPPSWRGTKPSLHLPINIRRDKGGIKKTDRHGEERSHLYTCQSTSGGLRGHLMPHAIPNELGIMSKLIR